MSQAMPKNGIPSSPIAAKEKDKRACSTVLLKTYRVEPLKRPEKMKR